MCGIMGVVSDNCNNSLDTIIRGLYYLKGRGQDSTGASIFGLDGKIHTHKVPNHIGEKFVQLLKKNSNGKIIIGQTRYSTSEKSLDDKIKLINAQPICIRNKGLEGSLVHNGHIENKEKIKSMVKNISHNKATSDTRYLAELCLLEFSKKDPWKAAEHIMKNVNGAYSIIFLKDRKLYVMRDPWGIRPLYFGEMDGVKIFISETGFFNRMGTKFKRWIKPGELLIVDENGKMETKGVLVKKRHKHCFFEPQYLMNEYSVANDCKVAITQFRHSVGRDIFNFYKNKENAKVNADIVMSAPRSADHYALGFAYESRIPCFLSLKKNADKRYFIEPKEKRNEKDKIPRFAPDYYLLKGKNVAVIDDSIVRADTILKIFKALKDAGAKRIEFYSACPPYFFPCKQGIDTPTRKELVAHSLIEKGVINYNVPLNYDISVVNEEITNIIRERIMIREQNKEDKLKNCHVDDLIIRYAPIEIIKKNMPRKDNCYQCVNGIKPN